VIGNRLHIADGVRNIARCCKNERARSNRGRVFGGGRRGESVFSASRGCQNALSPNAVSDQNNTSNSTRLGL
jgi:hypothetical protein